MRMRISQLPVIGLLETSLQCTLTCDVAMASQRRLTRRWSSRQVSVVIYSDAVLYTCIIGLPYY